MRRSTMVTAALLQLGGAAACGDGTRAPELERLEPEALAFAEQGADPSLAVDPETGDLLLAWVAEREGAWGLHFARSSDGGERFTEPRRVGDPDQEVVPHAEGGPRLVAAPGVAALFWNNRFDVEGRRFAAGDLLFARSVDGGETWSPQRVIQDPLQIEGLPPRGNTFHGAAWNGDSALVVAWLDGRERDARRVERGVARGLPAAEAARAPDDLADEDDPADGDAAVYAAVSHDLGETWEEGNRRIAGAACPCCRVGLTAGPEGEVLGGWRRHFGSDVRDPAVGTVLEGGGPAGASAGEPGAAAGEPGASAGEPVRIHDDGWVFPGCPHSGPGLDVDADGRIHAAWYTGADGRMGVHYARTGGTGSPASGGTAEPAPDGFGEPVALIRGDRIPIAHPAVTALPDGGAVVAHNVDAEGRRVIVVTGVGADGAVVFQREIRGSEGGTHPQMVRLPDGRVVVAWSASREGLQHVGLVRITLAGGSGRAEGS